MANLFRTKSIKSVWTILFLFMFVCCSGVMTTWFVSKRTAANALDKKLKELASKGVPIDDASMTVYHQRLSTDENSTRWARLIDVIASKDFVADCAGLPVVTDGPPIPSMDQPWNEQQSVEQFLQKHADTVNELVDLAQNNGPVRFPIKFNSFATLLPYTQNTRGAARVLLLEAQLAAHLKDPEREFRAINALLGCSISLRSEPTMVSQLVSIAIHGIGLNQLQNAVQLARLRPQDYERLKQRLEQFSNIKQVYTVGLHGELGLGSSAMRDAGTLREQFGNWSPVLVETGIADRAALKHAEHLEEALETNVEDLKAFRKQMNELDSRIAQNRTRFNIGGHISSMFVPALNSFSGALIRHKMGNDLAILGVTIRQYEQLHGKLPSSLTDLESLGIDLQQYKASDGSMPNYLLLDPALRPGINCRAVLWSFDCRTETVISPKPPEMINSYNTEIWWHWDLK